MAAIRVLREFGPALGRPLVDTVKASKYKNMKELRPPSSGTSEIRVLFAFDPQRSAILLVGGDKQGAWSKWYLTSIPIADRRYADHVRALSSAKPESHGRSKRRK